MLFAQKKAGISSYEAAKKMDVKYRAGILRNPLITKPIRKPQVLDKHRDYLMQSLRKWKAFSLLERAQILNLDLACPTHAQDKDSSCQGCQSAVHVSGECLRQWYKRNKINHGVAPYRIGASYSEE
jgi:hypothetical protein